ncbi:MAG: hypothetical protein GY926_03450 [bacterium]|nr:hypothetical protein [bacterium]
MESRVGLSRFSLSVNHKSAREASGSFRTAVATASDAGIVITAASSKRPGFDRPTSLTNTAVWTTIGIWTRDVAQPVRASSRPRARSRLGKKVRVVEAQAAGMTS